MKLGFFKKGQKGFTLVEMMVVMAIMAVLATIVVPAVTGTKEVSESSQMKTDASALRNAITIFQNTSLTSAWPEQTFDGSSGNYTNTEYTKMGTLGVTSSTHKEINWDAVTLVRQDDGSSVSLALVPDFLDKQPGTVILKRDALHEYIWLLAIEAEGTTQETRVVEVYKLNAAADAYEQKY